MQQEVSAGMTNGKEIVRPKNTSFSISSSIYRQLLWPFIKNVKMVAGTDFYLVRSESLIDSSDRLNRLACMSLVRSSE